MGASSSLGTATPGRSPHRCRATARRRQPAPPSCTQARRGPAPRLPRGRPGGIPRRHAGIARRLPPLPCRNLAARAGPLRNLGRAWPKPAHHGRRLLGQPRRSADGLLRRAGRALRGAKRRQPRAALPAGCRLPRHQRGAGVRRARSRACGSSSSSATRSAAACAPCWKACRPAPRTSSRAGWASAGRRAPGCSGATPAAEEARQEAGEHEMVRLSLENLLTFPWIREAVEAGRLRLHGGAFRHSLGHALHARRGGPLRPGRRRASALSAGNASPKVRRLRHRRAGRRRRYSGCTPAARRIAE